MPSTSNPHAQRLGFIGLGVMGAPMAAHLAAARHDVTVFDIDPLAMIRLKTRNPRVQIARTPAEVAAAADVVFTMLPSGRFVRDVALGEQGLVHALRAGSLLIDTSSSEPWLTRETATALAGRGIAMVDAPVSGAEPGAQAAELVFMVGGEAADVARAEPLLRLMGQQVFHLGPLGAGHSMKTINNLITAVTFMATAEGLVLGRKYGLDPAVMNDVLNLCTGQSWITANHIPQRILNGRYDDPFKLELMLKDVNIALRMATEGSLQLPLSAAAQEQWQQSHAQSELGASVSQIVRNIERANNVTLVDPAAED